jgi:hypothetical protein
MLKYVLARCVCFVILKRDPSMYPNLCMDINQTCSCLPRHTVRHQPIHKPEIYLHDKYPVRILHTVYRLVDVFRTYLASDMTEPCFTTTGVTCQSKPIYKSIHTSHDIIVLVQTKRDPRERCALGTY